MSPREQWNENDAAVTVTECKCGEVRPCILTADPYASELYPEDGPYPDEWWCRPCYEDRADDI